MWNGSGLKCTARVYAEPETKKHRLLLSLKKASEHFKGHDIILFLRFNHARLKLRS